MLFKTTLNAVCISIYIANVWVTYKTGSGSDEWIYCTLYTTPRNYRQYSPTAILHSLQFTVPHALGFSVFTSRILVTNLSKSHCNFKSHVKSSCHILIPILPLFCGCKFRRFDSIQFLCSQAHIPAGWRLETGLSTLNYCSLIGLVFWLCPFITSRHGQHRKQPLLLRSRVYWSVT
jgi:hypothetical protein